MVMAIFGFNVGDGMSDSNLRRWRHGASGRVRPVSALSMVMARARIRMRYEPSQSLNVSFIEHFDMYTMYTRMITKEGYVLAGVCGSILESKKVNTYLLAFAFYSCMNLKHDQKQSQKQCGLMVNMQG